MRVKIQSVHFDADQKLVGFIEERINKLQHFYEGIIGSDVVLKLEKSNTAENKVAEIRLEIKGNDLFSKRNSSTFEEAVDLCISALRTQVKKHKEKIQGV
jgi:putative sigma-54 modulation protein